MEYKYYALKIEWSMDYLATELEGKAFGLLYRDTIANSTL